MSAAATRAVVDGRSATPVGGAPHRRDIQGLRAIAVLVVVAYHAGLPIPGGFVGVDVFFVISGFVITSMLQREWLAHGRVELARFYIRRFKRLVPALSLTVCATMVMGVLLLSPLGTLQSTTLTGIGAMAFTANVVIARTTGGYFDAPAETNALLNTWSLSVEEQFYFAFPLVLVAGWWLQRRSGGRKAVLALVGAMGIASFALAMVGTSPVQLSLPPRLVYLASMLLGFYSPVVRAWEFAVGAALALSGRVLTRMPRPAGVTSAVVGACLLVGSVWTISGSTPFPGVWTLLPVLATLLLIAGRTEKPHFLQRLLSSGPMVAMGDRSYSIYLWHWPFIVAARALWPESSVATIGAAILSLLSAFASFAWVEQPIRSRVVASRGGALRLVALSLLPPFAIGAAVLWGAGRGFGMEQVRAYQAAVLPEHAGQKAGCTASLPWTRLTQCTWGAALPGPPVYLIGDSQADHLSEGAIQASRGLGRPLVNLGVDGCAFTGVHQAGSLCDRVFAGVDHHLGQAAPGVVILSNGTAERDVHEVTTSLMAAGHAVILIQAVPKFVDWRPDTCSMLRLVAGSCSGHLTLSEAGERQGPARDRLRGVAIATQATLLDTWPRMCPQDPCSTETTGLIRYRDEDHITVAQSMAFAPEIADAIRRASSDRM